MGLFSSKKTTYDPMSGYTAEQQSAIRALMSLASTGSGGGITLGQLYGGDLGYYNQTPGEIQALSGIQGLISGQDITGARDVYSRLAENKFDPEDPTSGYASFSRALAKAGKESVDVINREAARSGGVFGSGRGKEISDLAEDLANQRGMFLADLYNQGETRALQGATGLQGLVGTQIDLFNQLASQAAIERLLKDQAAKEKYAEFTRARNEELSRIGLMQEQWQNPMGTITTKSPSTFMRMFGEVNPIVGSYNTQKYGYTTGQTSIGDFVSSLSKLFSAGAFSGVGNAGSNINLGGGNTISGYNAASNAASNAGYGSSFTSKYR